MYDDGSLTLAARSASRRVSTIPATHRHGEGGAAQALVVLATPVAGLRKLWREAIRGFAIDEVADQTQLVRSLVQRRPAFLLLDLRLPQLGGLAGLAALRRLEPATKIVVLAERPDEQEGIAALRMGARGYCSRAISAGLLGKALAAVQNGEIWADRRLTTHLLQELNALTEAQRRQSLPIDRAGRFGCLTPRERDIVDLLGAGASNKEIAHRLAVTERTVKAHLTAVFRKLGISGRLQVALLVVEESRCASTAGGIRRRFN